MKTRAFVVMLCCATTAAVLSVSAQSKTRRDAWIVHAGDPHLYVDVINEQTQPDEKPLIEKQRALNEQALKDLLAQVTQLVGVEGEPRALVLSGDFDTDPCWFAGVPRQTANENRADVVSKCLSTFRKDEREKQVKTLATILAASPVRDIYVMPGNTDVAREDAGDAPLKYFHDFISDVQKGITVEQKSRVQLHDLIGCYAGGVDTDCSVDIADTPYRILAGPSYSFKNADDASLKANDAAQLREIQKFSGLVDQARTAGRKVIIVTHVPNIDDPFVLARTKYAVAPKRPDMKVDGRSPSSTWNVTQPVLDAWKAAASSDAVAAILAGHFHDSHREIYRQPYAWSTPDKFADDRSKLFLTPPLAVKNQDMSPAQARGFSLIHLEPERVRRVLYWYDADARTFTADRDFAAPKPEAAPGFWRAVVGGGPRWLWRLSSDTALTRLAVLLIAFLVAFLTVARVWQIPPPKDSDAAKAGDAKSGDAKSGNAQSSEFEASPFKGPLGATVLAGLGGLVAETVVKALSNSSAKNGTEFYVVWFVLFFFVMLVGAALMQGILEAFRVRLAIVQFTYVRPSPRSYPAADETKLAIAWEEAKNSWQKVTYWIRRRLEWLYSWRYAGVVLLDTFLQRIQGKNQVLSAIFGEVVKDDQKNIARVADTIRDELNKLLNERAAALHAVHKKAAPPSGRGDIRVNISVMASDRSSVFYVATTPGSAPKNFPRRSVAWVSVFTQQIRWYKNTYRADDAVFSKIVLFDNPGPNPAIPEDEETVYLKSHFQPRDDDYDAFVVFPVPGSRRDASGQTVQGAIHVSFRRLVDFELFWKIGGTKDDPVLDPPRYRYTSEKLMLDATSHGWCLDPQTCDAISTAVRVTGEVLRGFNENVYKTVPAK